jgi:hypothetical protein
MPTCRVVIEGVFESYPAGGVIFHDATGIDDNAIAEVPKTPSARSRGSGLLHFARASQQNRTKMNDRFRVFWAATLTDCSWPN